MCRLLIFGKTHDVVHITEIPFQTELLLCEMVKLRQKQVAQILTWENSDCKSTTFAIFVAVYDFIEMFQKRFIFEHTPYCLFQLVVRYRLVKLLTIYLNIIPIGELVAVCLYSIRTHLQSTPFYASVGVVSHFGNYVRFTNVHNCVVCHLVIKRRTVYYSFFWLVHLELVQRRELERAVL